MRYKWSCLAASNGSGGKEFSSLSVTSFCWGLSFSANTIFQQQKRHGFISCMFSMVWTAWTLKLDLWGHIKADIPNMINLAVPFLSHVGSRYQENTPQAICHKRLEQGEEWHFDGRCDHWILADASWLILVLVNEWFYLIEYGIVLD